MSFEAFTERLKEAIEQSPATQGVIADHVGVSRQSVTNWKNTGQISTDNLRKLSEVTGYRYVWLKSGTGSKRFADPQANTAEFLETENGNVSEQPADYSDMPDEAAELIRSIKYAHANRKLNSSSIKALTTFFNSLVNND